MTGNDKLSIKTEMLDDYRTLFTVDFIAPETGKFWLMSRCNTNDGGTRVIGPIRAAYFGCK